MMRALLSKKMSERRAFQKECACDVIRFKIDPINSKPLDLDPFCV